MFSHHHSHIHKNDREALAQRVGLTLGKFDRLVETSNQAFEVLKELGPFYGKEEIKEPTFRIVAEPVTLPKGSKKLLTELGDDLLHFARALPHLEISYKKVLGEDINFDVPPTWRIDAILDNNNKIKINEIEGVDGASALMMAEQQAYGLQKLHESSAAKLFPTLKAMCHKHNHNHKRYKLALIINASWNHAINAKRFINFLEILSKDTLKIDLLDADALREGTSKPDWKEYAGVLGERAITPSELFRMGVQKEQIISVGNYNAICSKGIFALLFDEKLTNFWYKYLGLDRYNRLKDKLIPTKFVTSKLDLAKAKEEGQVVKVAWAKTNFELIHRSKGVAMPTCDSEHGSDERWNLLKDLIGEDASIIAQKYIEPQKISAFLRKKGSTLEPVSWHNRICVKYVVDGDPNGKTIPEVHLTATEVTLGPNVIPAGRKCAFTAGKLQ
jgi:hypothetical protein